MSNLSRALLRIKASPTVAITAKAAELKASGRDVIAMSAGEPDFDTPKHIRAAAAEAMDAGKTRYTAPNGIPELRRAIAEKFERENGLEFGLDEIIASTGGKQALFNAMIATIDPGDEVIIPAPYWVSYPDIALFAGGVPVTIPASLENGYRIRPDQLEAAITPRTKWVIINSPSNPSGAGYSKDDLAALAAVLERHPHVWILSDDIYEHIVYAPFEFHSILQVSPSLRSRTVIVNGVSKSYAMTGWRLGYAAGPAEIIAAMTTLQSQSTSNPSTISQWAAIAALSDSDEYVAMSREVFRKRRDLVVEHLNACPGVTCPTPDGAFYVYPSIAELIGFQTPAGVEIESDQVFAEELLAQTGVAVVFGAAFGLSPYFRVSYACADDVLIEACRRINAFCSSLA